MEPQPRHLRHLRLCCSSVLDLLVLSTAGTAGSSRSAPSRQQQKGKHRGNSSTTDGGSAQQPPDSESSDWARAYAALPHVPAVYSKLAHAVGLNDKVALLAAVRTPPLLQLSEMVQLVLAVLLSVLLRHLKPHLEALLQGQNQLSDAALLRMQGQLRLLATTMLHWAAQIPAPVGDDSVYWMCCCCLVGGTYNILRTLSPAVSEQRVHHPCSRRHSRLKALAAGAAVSAAEASPAAAAEVVAG